MVEMQAVCERTDMHPEANTRLKLNSSAGSHMNPSPPYGLPIDLAIATCIVSFTDCTIAPSLIFLDKNRLDATLVHYQT